MSLRAPRCNLLFLLSSHAQRHTRLVHVHAKREPKLQKDQSAVGVRLLQYDETPLKRPPGDQFQVVAAENNSVERKAVRQRADWD